MTKIVVASDMVDSIVLLIKDTKCYQNSKKENTENP
jgi:hypothetical protein